MQVRALTIVYYKDCLEKVNQEKIKQNMASKWRKVNVNHINIVKYNYK